MKESKKEPFANIYFNLFLITEFEVGVQTSYYEDTRFCLLPYVP